MFKGFQDTGRSPLFRGFPNINFGVNTSAYGQGGVLLWLDAALNTSTQTNGANVSRWIDTTKRINFSQGTAGSQPTYISADANFNNLPSINFGAGSTRVMSAANQIPLGSTTLAIVVRTTTLANSGSMILGNAFRSGFMGGGTEALITGYGLYSDSSFSHLPYTRTNVEDTNSHIIVCNRSFFIVDGVDQLVTPSSFGFVFSQIGAGNGNYPSNCVIAEIVVYEALCSSAQCISICNNLNLKYAKY